MPNGQTFSQKIFLQESYTNAGMWFRVSWMIHSSRGVLLQTGTTARETLEEALQALLDEYQANILYPRQS